MRIFSLLLLLCLASSLTYAQLNWSKDGNSYVSMENGALTQTTMPSFTKVVLVKADQLAIPGNAAGSRFQRSMLSDDQQKILLYANAKRSYHNTFSSVWIYDRVTQKLSQAGKQFGESQLLNAKFSPDGSKLAYVFDNNIYVENLSTHQIQQLTKDGSDQRRNGWFDYASSEELFCTDGLRWSPDSKHIAFWQMDLSKVKVHYMINNTDSNYSKPVGLAFPKVGEPIAEAKIGVVTIDKKKIQWVSIPGDPANYYIPRMEWLTDGSRLIMQQLNRAQNESNLLLSSADFTTAKSIYKETDEAWIDLKDFWRGGGRDWDWINNGKDFLWASEKDGWRHLYRVGLDGSEQLLTRGNFDIMSISGTDEKNGWIYFIASPDTATQRYLYRSRLDGTGNAERVTPPGLPGTHSYSISPDGKWAMHNFSGYRFQPASEWLSMPAHQPINAGESIAKKLVANPAASKISFFTVTTAEGITMDGWMVKPSNFDPSQKYPLIFTVYSEPFATTVNDVSGVGRGGGFFNVDSGYIFISVEGRGAPSPKGRAWRKAIYKNLGWINSNDQAMAAKEIMKWPFIDTSRIAVFGGSGGGSTTMHLLFRFPEIYKVGIASAGVPNQLVYNSIYEERFMGLLPANRADYIKGSAITYARNLRGHLLILHGTGDHNVHYAGEEMLLNELIKYNRQFVFMPYPNRTHGISEGEGTGAHRSTLSASFLRQYCPPGGR
jgi:dipeptidyl-peptidase 4